MDSKFDYEKILTAQQKRILLAYRRRLNKGKIHTIAIDGLDGSGKRTLARTLAGRITDLGHNILIVAYPAYELPFGKETYENQLATHVKMKYKSRFLLYALNRAETAFSVMRRANELSRGKNSVYILFDRYWTSNLVTRSYIMYKKGQSDTTELRMKQLLTFMKRIDFWLITLLSLEDTPVFVPVVSANEADSAMSERVWNKDEYEQRPVQSIAGELYRKASESSELDMRIIEQFDEEEPGKRLSPNKVADKVFNQIDCKKGTGKGSYHVIIYKDDLMSSNLVEESSRHYKKQVEELKEKGFWPDVYLKEISDISKEYDTRQKALQEKIAIKGNIYEQIPKEEYSKIVKHLKQLELSDTKIDISFNTYTEDVSIVQMNFLENEFEPGGLLKSKFPIRAFIHVLRSHLAPYVPKVEQRKVQLPKQQRKIHPEPYLEEMFGKDESTYGKLHVGVIPLIYRIGERNRLELLMGQRHIRSLANWYPKGLVPISEEVFIDRPELLPFHSDPSRELYQFERMLWDYNGGIVDIFPRITGKGLKNGVSVANLKFRYLEDKPYTMETLYYTLVRGLLEELTGIDTQEILMQGGISEIPNIQNTLDRKVRKYIEKYQSNVLSLLYAEDRKIYSNYRVIPLFERLLGSYIDISSGEPWLLFVIAVPALGNPYEKAFLRSKDWQRKMGSEPLWVRANSADIVDGGARAAVRLIKEAYEKKKLPFMKPEYYC